ncbi:ATP-binding protein [Ideonella livida]|nr:ATP-binding protein [Ideonella livida]
MQAPSLRWAWALALLGILGMVLVLSFVLSLLAQGPLVVERHFVWLFWVNLSVTTVLAVVLTGLTIQLLSNLRRRLFGSRLLFKLAAIFGLVGVLPGALIYTVSYQFVSRTIEAWFDARVESALDAGLALGKGTLAALSEDLSLKTRSAAERLGDAGTGSLALALERSREQMGAEVVAVVAGNGHVLLSATERPAMVVDRPPAAMVRHARELRSISQIEGLDDETAPASGVEARVRALARIPSVHVSLAGEEERYLMALRQVPASVTGPALVVQAAYKEYQQRHLARDGLRRMYIGTLTLTLALSVFGAVVLAVVLGRQLVRPLLVLAEGVRQVAQGDLTAKPVLASRDELGGLTRSFADMTEQLSSARAQAERSLRALEASRTRLQTILDHLSTGVIVFDPARRVEVSNPAAARILHEPAVPGWSLGEGDASAPVAAFLESLWRHFDALAQTDEDRREEGWQDSFQLPVPQADHSLTLLVRGAPLPGGASLVVFDDITELVSAQRTEAWGEVARRVAHEIKNPLTPIQLSAERLRHKLEAKLAEPDQAFLGRAVDTIVVQVQALKKLVNEFRDYARLPAAKLVALDLNALVAEVLALYGDELERQRLEARCLPDLPPVRGDATQLRQVIHNLVQNALQAVEGQPDGRVLIETDLAKAAEGQARFVRLRISDNGPGFSEKVLKRAFEPYVTTKSKGTGLGLAVVKKISDEHGARVRIVNLPPREGVQELASGAQVSLSFLSITEQRAPTVSAPSNTGAPS